MIWPKNTKIIQLILAEKKTEKRIKIRMKEENKKLMLDILKKDFKIVSWKELKL